MDFGFILSSAAGELFSPTTAAYALAALGLAVHFGYSGLLNFGQAGFMAVGAYGFAISTLTFQVPFFVGPAHRRRLLGDLRAAAGHSNPPAEGRLPGHRHDRGGGNRPLYRHHQPADLRDRFGERPGGLRRRLLRHEPVP